MSDFYAVLAPYYHLLFDDWDAGMRRQGRQLASVIRAEWPGHESILDVSCGIGTQSIALSAEGFQVAGSDLSSQQIERARREASARRRLIDFKVCDMRHAAKVHGSGWDLVLSCDNSIPHLLSDGEIRTALREMFTCLRPGGGCVLTVRDYAKESRGRNILKPYPVRMVDGVRYSIFQVWDFTSEDHYDLTLYIVEDRVDRGTVQVVAGRSRYYAVGTDRLLNILEEVGFENAKRLDDVFYQPVLVATRPDSASGAA